MTHEISREAWGGVDIRAEGLRDVRQEGWDDVGPQPGRSGDGGSDGIQCATGPVTGGVGGTRV